MKIIELSILQRENIFINNIRELIGVTVCDWQLILPVIEPLNYCVNQGDTFEANILIANYSRSYDLNSTYFIANGDTLKMDENGLAYYKHKTTKKGTVELNIETRTINKLTNEILAGSSTYKYIVR